MVQRVQIVLEDDIDGSTASEQFTFAFDGISYEIDLNEENAQEFRETMARWTTHARRASNRTGRSRRASAASSGPSATEIREWAKSQGMEVNARGRVPKNVRDAYEAAHG